MRRQFSLDLGGGRVLELGERTLVVGVLNVTPDSFSDGGQNFDPARAVERALKMEHEGAGIVEIGGESTRPGASRIQVGEELSRVMPVLTALAGRLRLPISIDTYKSEVARQALDAGASIVNDVSALRFDPAVADVVAGRNAPLVLMHMRGEPATMQKIEASPNIFAEIETDLSHAIRVAEQRGVGRRQLVIDPGIGFGKTLEQNLAIINHLERLEHLGLPLMVGPSRKSFIAKLTRRDESDRVFGTAASIAVSIMKGAQIVRVHDVAEMVEVARITDAILASA